MKRTVVSVVCGWMFLLAMILGGGGSSEVKAADEKIKFNFGHVMPIEHPEHKASVRMAELIKEKSGDRITMNIFPSTQLGGDRELMTSLMAGTLEMATCATFGSVEPKIMVVEMPYIFEDYGHILNFMKSDIQKELLSLLEPHGAIGLGYYPAGARHIGNVRKVVNKPEDLNDLLIRVYEHELLKDTIAALGAKVTVTPYSEVYMALATHAIDGEENPFVNTYAMKFYESEKFKTETHHMDQLKIVGASKKWWDSLSEKDQDIIQQSFYEAFAYYMDLMKESNNEYKELLRKDGVTVTEIDDYTPWRNAVKPVYEKWSKKFGPELISEIQALAD